MSGSEVVKFNYLPSLQIITVQSPTPMRNLFPHDTGIDTLLQCAVEDLDHQMKRPQCNPSEDDDDDMPRFMGPGLLDAFGESAKAKGGGCCSSAPEDKPKSETNKMNSKGEAEAEVSV